MVEGEGGREGEGEGEGERERESQPFLLWRVPWTVTLWLGYPTPPHRRKPSSQGHLVCRKEVCLAPPLATAFTSLPSPNENHFLLDVEKCWATHPGEGVFPTLNNNEPHFTFTRLVSPTPTPVLSLTDSETQGELRLLRGGEVPMTSSEGDAQRRPLSETLFFSQRGVWPPGLAAPSEPVVLSEEAFPLPHNSPVAKENDPDTTVVEDEGVSGFCTPGNKGRSSGLPSPGKAENPDKRRKTDDAAAPGVPGKQGERADGKGDGAGRDGGEGRLHARPAGQEGAAAVNNQDETSARILGATEKFTQHQEMSSTKAEERHRDLLHWQHQLHNEQELFKKEVVNKFLGLDKAMDELRMGQAEAASVADPARRAVENLEKTNRGGAGGKGGGGAPAAVGVTKEDLDKMLEGVETRLTKFVVTEVGKLQDRPLNKNEEKLPRRTGWNARQEDTGVLIGGFPPHTRKAKVEDFIKKMCGVLLVEPAEIFSLGKRTQYGMIKMQANEEAWQFVRDVKTKEWVRKFEGYDLWATIPEGRERPHPAVPQGRLGHQESRRQAEPGLRGRLPEAASVRGRPARRQGEQGRVHARTRRTGTSRDEVRRAGPRTRRSWSSPRRA